MIGPTPERHVDRRRAFSAGAIFLVLITVYQTLVLTDVTSDVIRKGIETDEYQMIWTDVAWGVSVFFSLIASASVAGRFGPRTTLAWGIGIFALGNLLCGAAQGLESMVIAKVVDGIGKGLTTGMARATLYRQFSRSLLVAIGFYGVVAYATRPFTPFVTSFVNDWLSWRWIFWVNVPVALVALAGVLLYIPADPPRPSRPEPKAKPAHPWAGLIGMAMLCGWLVCLMFTFKWYRKWGGWTSPHFAAVAFLSVALPIGLAAWFGSGVSMDERLGRILRSRVYVLAMMARLLLLLNLAAVPSIAASYMLDLRDYPRDLAGWLMAPAAATMATSTLLTTIFQRRSLRHFWGFVGVVGTAACLWWFSTLDNYTPKGRIALIFACWGAFIGLFPPLFLADEVEGVAKQDRAYAGILAIVGLVLTLLIVPTITSTLIKAWSDRAADVYRANIAANRPAVEDSAARIADHFGRMGLTGEDLERQTAAVLGSYVKAESAAVGFQEGFRYFSLMFLALGIFVMTALAWSARGLQAPPDAGYR